MWYRALTHVQAAARVERNVLKTLKNAAALRVPVRTNAKKTLAAQREAANLGVV